MESQEIQKLEAEILQLKFMITEMRISIYRLNIWGDTILKEISELSDESFMGHILEIEEFTQYEKYLISPYRDKLFELMMMHDDNVEKLEALRNEIISEPPQG